MNTNVNTTGNGNSTAAYSCNQHPSTSNDDFSNFLTYGAVSFEPQYSANSYYNFTKQDQNLNSLQPSLRNHYFSSGPVQSFQKNYTNVWVQGCHGDRGGFSGPGSTVSSHNGSPAHSVISHISRHSTTSQLTVVTNISPIAYCGSSLSAPEAENIDPQYEQKALPMAIDRLCQSLENRPLEVVQEVQYLRQISQCASRYNFMEFKCSRLSEVVDRSHIGQLLLYILNRCNSIISQYRKYPNSVPNDPYQVLRRLWKLLGFLVRCDICTDTLLKMKREIGLQNLLQCILEAINLQGSHTPYTILVFRRLLESRHGSEFRQCSRIKPAIEVLLNYLPNCHRAETPKQSAIASGNKFEVIDCCRILMSAEQRTGKLAKDDPTHFLRKKFVEMGGVDRMLEIVRNDVEEPVLSAATGALKAIVKMKGSEQVAESMVRKGAIQLLADRLDHGSPILVQNCLICMANICDQKVALETQPIEKLAISQTINVIGTSDIQIDQFASAFLVNVSTIPKFKEVVIRSGAIKTLLRIINQHAFTFFLEKVDFRRVFSKPYVDVLDNSIRVIAYLSRNIGHAAAQQVQLELSTFDDSLQLLANLVKAQPKPSTALCKSARKFRFLSRENLIQLRRHVLLIVQRNLQMFDGHNPFKERLANFSEAYVFPQAAFDMIYELNDALIRIQSEGDLTHPSILSEKQEIKKLLFNVAIPLVEDFSKRSEFTKGITTCFQKEHFVSFFASFGRHDIQSELKLVEFCRGFATASKVGDACVEIYCSAFPLNVIEGIVGRIPKRTLEISNAYELLVALDMNPSGGFDPSDSMEMDCMS
ncbi:hypothetical protein L596_019005 [Steinernema carpocapsae]|uniref:Armadillo repeat-containing domain-containing protein n=1 Tax=Steinernema carpocapsae TaxID=34508 RepID=A0A4U5N6V5_STECR|nr:hypothetical protein L596_019005 [Steinernema carpocapsae]